MKAFTLATLMTLAASPVFAFNLSDAANAVSAMQNQNSTQQGQVQAPAGQANLLNTLGSELKITLNRPLAAPVRCWGWRATT